MASDALHRRLTWTYRRGRDECRCVVMLAADASVYELHILRPRTSPHVERFNDALEIINRQTAVEGALIASGWQLDEFTRRADLRRCATERDR